MTEQKKSLMKELEAMDYIPQEELDERHTGRLYPTELDLAIENEEPLVYSRSKLINLISIEITPIDLYSDSDYKQNLEQAVVSVSKFVDSEIKPFFNLI